MNQEKLYELLGDIDPDMIAAANKPIPFYQKRSFKIALIAAVLACTVALTTVAGAFTLVIGSGILKPDLGDDNQTDTQEPGVKPGGLAGELFDVDWGALKNALGNDGNVNWQDVLSALKGKDNTSHDDRLRGHVYKSVKQKDGTVKITEVITNSEQTVIEIPETLAGGTVAAIGEGAFKGNQNVTHVSIPDTVTVIEEAAFYGCTNLLTVDMSDNVQKIAENAFSDCHSLTTINLPDTLKQLGEYAFANCPLLTNVTIPYGIKEIPDYAFYGTGITSVVIPTSVVRIGDYAFAECRNLESITFAKDCTVVQFGSIPALTYQRLESIGASAFDSTAITGIEFPHSLTNLYDVDFKGCPNLQAVIFDGNAPTVQVAPAHDRSSPAYTVYFKPGAQGFGNGAWYGYTCTLMQYDTDKNMEKSFKKAHYGTVPFHNVGILVDTVLGSVTEEVTLIDAYSEYQPFSTVLKSPRYSREYFVDYAIVIIRVEHNSAEQVMGLAALGAQLYTTGGVYYFDLCPVVMIDCPDGDQPDDINYTYIVAEVQRTNIRKDNVTRVGKVAAYEIDTQKGSAYHPSLSEVLGDN